MGYASQTELRAQTGAEAILEGAGGCAIVITGGKGKGWEPGDSQGVVMLSVPGPEVSNR